MNKIILTEYEKGIVEIKLNRPETYNAVDFDMMDELHISLKKLHDTKDIRAIMITGEGDRAFCSGGDVNAFEQLKTKEEAYDMLSKMGEVLYQILMLPIPTFALINGIALGGGCEIATACDVRIAKQGAEIGFIQGNLAITTGWGGATLLHEKMPYDKAMSLLLSAKRISVEEAHSLEFIQKIVEESTYRTEAIQFILNSLVEYPLVLRAYKSVKIDQWQQTGLLSRMKLEINRCAELWEMENHHNAVSRFVNRKK